MSMETFTLRSGVTIPSVGFGMYLVPVAAAQRVCEEGLSVGYRHIDTAEYYRNEAEVGAGVRASGIPRSEIFVTSKVMPEGGVNVRNVRQALEVSLSRMAFDYLDLYLVHWSSGSAPGNRALWEQMLEVQQAGLARSIGVSNFSAADLGALSGFGASNQPEVNQLQVHPAVPNVGPVEASVAHGALIEAWGPLGQGRFDYANSVAGEIASRLDVTWAQVILRWQLQRGRVILPKSTHVERMRQNLDLFGFELAEEDLVAIESIG